MITRTEYIQMTRERNITIDALWEYALYMNKEAALKMGKDSFTRYAPLVMGYITTKFLDELQSYFDNKFSTLFLFDKNEKLINVY